MKDAIFTLLASIGVMTLMIGVITLFVRIWYACQDIEEIHKKICGDEKEDK